MTVESLPITTLHLDPANARLHSPRNLEAIKSSLHRFGQQKPIVIDARNIVRAGNGSHPAMIRHRARSPLWRLRREPSFTTCHTGLGHVCRGAGARLTAAFEYVGPP